MLAGMRKVWLAAFVAVAALAGGAALAQDVPSEPEKPSPAEPAPTPDDSTGPETGRKEKQDAYLGLYASASVGSFESGQMETDIETTALARGDNALKLDDMNHARFAVGWRFAEDKGDIRLFWNGFDEEEYTFSSTGQLSSSGQFQTLQLVTISGSTLNNVNYVSGATFQEPVADSLQNQLQTVDVMYGREFGGRRYHSHWWGGLRYFGYEGNILAGTWLTEQFAPTTGAGFTDSQFLPLINNLQESSGFGPTGAWEVDFSFFDKGFTLFLRGQTALVFTSIQTDTGIFVVPVPVTAIGGASVLLPVEVRAVEKRDKTSWQNTGEVGARLGWKNGLQFEVGYTISGYLDVIITPSALTLPDANQSVGNLCDSPETCAAANYITRDLDVDGWYATVAFQF